MICIFTGAPLGADLALPPELHADVTDYASYRLDWAQTGLQFVLWGMTLALAVGLALPSFESAGLNPEVPSDTNSLALIVIYALIPVGLVKVIINLDSLEIFVNRSAVGCYPAKIEEA